MDIEPRFSCQQLPESVLRMQKKNKYAFVHNLALGVQRPRHAFSDRYCSQT